MIDMGIFNALSTFEGQILSNKQETKSLKFFVL